jgi:hypothetical protein
MGQEIKIQASYFFLAEIIFDCWESGKLKTN